MASVVQGTNGNYDLPRGLRLYDSNGDLPERARALWAIVEDDALEMAREFWRRYARSPEVTQPIDAAKIDELAGRHGVSNTTIAIAWLLRHPARMQPVTGTTNTGRLRDCCRASDVNLSREEWYEVYRAAGNVLP